MKRILVLGAGGAAANGFTRALRMAGDYYTIGTNCDEYDLELSETDEQILIPRAAEGHYGDAVVKLAAQVDLVHAQSDLEVEKLSLLRDRLPVFLPSEGVIHVCHNKWYSNCKWQGKVPQPDTQLIRNPAELDTMFEKHGKVWLRNIYGAGGAGSIATDDLALGKAWLDHHNGWGWFTAAEVLTPETATWTGLFAQGESIVCQGRKRESWAYARNQPSGVSGITGVGVTTNDVDLHETSLDAVLAIDDMPHGLYGVDCTLDRQDRWNPTEINIGRFHTTVPEFFARAGLNIADLYCRTFFGEDVGDPKPLPDGIKWVRTMDKEPVCLSPP